MSWCYSSRGQKFNWGAAAPCPPLEPPLCSCNEIVRLCGCGLAYSKRSCQGKSIGHTRCFIQRHRGKIEFPTLLNITLAWKKSVSVESASGGPGLMEGGGGGGSGSPRSTAACASRAARIVLTKSSCFCRQLLFLAAGSGCCNTSSHPRTTATHTAR